MIRYRVEKCELIITLVAGEVTLTKYGKFKNFFKLDEIYKELLENTVRTEDYLASLSPAEWSKKERGQMASIQTNGVQCLYGGLSITIEYIEWLNKKTGVDH
jgi:hypothetical protein